jgi:glutamate synthase (ferredoxin)
MAYPNHITNYISEKDACGTGFIFSPNASHKVLTDTLQAIARLDHRGACGGDSVSGDGAGVLTTIPWDLFENQGYHRRQHQAAAVFYLPPDKAAFCQEVMEELLSKRGFNHFVWRSVPVAPALLGPLARSTQPQIVQLLLSLPKEANKETAEQYLSSARKYLLNHFRDQLAIHDFYVASFSTRTIVYKAMVKGPVLGEFYPDLLDPAFQTNWSVYHRRFSTNTLPRWALAQPFRILAHNGEINTLLGNLNWMKARESVIVQALPEIMRDYLPVIDPNGSDSANLDDTLELLLRCGHSIESALMQLIPEAHASKNYQSNQTAAFYQYYAALQEPWDGPALIVFSDGSTTGATMDRNGLRPARFTLLDDGSVIFGSESGIIDTPQEEVRERGRLGPGEMLTVNLETAEVRKNGEIKQTVAQQYHFGDWLKSERHTLPQQPFLSSHTMSASELLANQQALGYGKEDVEVVLATMAGSGAEPVFSMGDDTPLAVLSRQPKTLYEYFKQRFAQVTNPPIDHLREKLVMSIDVHLGRRNDLVKPSRAAAKSLHLRSPFLNEAELDALLGGTESFAAERLSLLFRFDRGETLDSALAQLCANAETAISSGKVILVLSDRGLSRETLAIPPLMAVGALHHHLIEKGLRLDCSIVVETGQCWSVHHYACLLGFGAQAVCPYLALETIRHKFSDQLGVTVGQAQTQYKLSVEEGLQKVLSKMGISVLSSYVGAQIFECIGLGPGVINRCFAGTVSRIGGLEIDGITQDLQQFHINAYPEPVAQLRNYGIMTHRPDGEFHGNNPQVVRTLHKALGFKDNGIGPVEKQAQFKEYTRIVRGRQPAALRDLLTFSSDRQPIPLEQVEPVEEIVKRFCTGGMSLGALSKEAHEVLAIAMNRLNGKSNSGEGGEDPLRYYPIDKITPEGTSPDFPGLIDLQEGDSAASAIRQVASARFGVTTEYLVTAKQLEIKIAQGAKPGEGGQLPGHKVSSYIARLRLAKPGIPLISPPPHHDIYSIEDLAQLIFDLRRVNPAAKISVKLVSEVGIGTVAAGVAKADAEIIQISGHDGGTGASPLSSIKNAGLPWELGLAEVQQALKINQLRDRVLLRVDGGLRSGWDIVISALLGADEYGFGSIALIAGGCIMARICHTNNCPVGITSQKENLRKRFLGSPKPVIEFFLFLAEEVRHILSQLGYRSISEIIGRTDLLRQRDDVTLPKLATIDLSCLFSKPYTNQTDLPAIETKERTITGLDELLLANADVAKAISVHGLAEQTLVISNSDRSVGARLSGAIASQYGDHGFNGKITVNFTGTAGQSFGAFNVKNLRLILTGDANDYVGKGMTGGEIVIKPQPGIRYRPEENTIAGNTCLYGATGGAFFAAGQVGERFAVRNSRATAVIEGAGDHCCEYMTGGIVVVLGKVGRNFGAGMTGGTAYVLDEDNLFEANFNADGDKKLRLVDPDTSTALKALIETHHRYTHSQRAAEILANWSKYLVKFKQVLPPKEEENPVWLLEELTGTGAHPPESAGQQAAGKTICEPVPFLEQSPDRARLGA